MNGSDLEHSFIFSWLAIRLEACGNLITFFAALFCIVQRENLSPGIAGLSISYSLSVSCSSLVEIILSLWFIFSHYLCIVHLDPWKPEKLKLFWSLWFSKLYLHGLENFLWIHRFIHIVFSLLRIGAKNFWIVSLKLDNGIHSSPFCLDYSIVELVSSYGEWAWDKHHFCWTDQGLHC